MSTKAAHRYADAMARLEVTDPDAYRAVKARVESYKTMNIKLRRAERDLTASVVQLEDDACRLEAALAQMREDACS